jgi:hypothetical protein
MPAYAAWHATPLVARPLRCCCGRRARPAALALRVRGGLADGLAVERCEWVLVSGCEPVLVDEDTIEEKVKWGRGCDTGRRRRQ